MKVKIVNKKAEFHPFTLEIEFETPMDAYEFREDLLFLYNEENCYYVTEKVLDCLKAEILSQKVDLNQLVQNKLKEDNDKAATKKASKKSNKQYD